MPGSRFFSDTEERGRAIAPFFLGDVVLRSKQRRRAFRRFTHSMAVARRQKSQVGQKAAHRSQSHAGQKAPPKKTLSLRPSNHNEERERIQPAWIKIHPRCESK